MNTSRAETELYQELVVEHKRAPRNFGRLEGLHVLVVDPSTVAEIADTMRSAAVRYTQNASIHVAALETMSEAAAGGVTLVICAALVKLSVSARSQKTFRLSICIWLIKDQSKQFVNYCY